MTEVIQQLSDDVADKIAAGEVIERPASVVKELLENSIDADATEIEVEFRKGGIEFIEVRDDGTGIKKKDLPLAVERHATSKINSADDLKTVETLGFRGEALASVASVAQLTIVSRPEEETEAAELSIDGGNKSVKPAGRKTGTTVRVQNLFETVPARRKFLKTERTERKHILREVRRKALAHPDIHFKLIEVEEEILNVPPGPLEDRVKQTLGSDIGETMINVDRLEPDWENTGRFGLSGLVSNGEITHGNRRHQFNFVNSRPVQDPVAYRAISKAYEKLRLVEDNPPVVLFLTIPPDEVDVNVHPRKEKIRYNNNQIVFRFLYNTVKETLQDHFKTGSEVEFAVDSPSGDRPENDSTPFVRNQSQPDRSNNQTEESNESQISIEDSPEKDGEIKESETIQKADRVLGQFRETFLVVEKSEGLFLFDQHTAHERVLYEEYRDKIEKREPAQYLSVPLTVDLEASDREFLLNQSEKLEDLGLTIEDFGGGTLAVQSVPGYLGRRADDKRMIYDMVEELLELKHDDVISDPADDLITIMSCRSAVMRGDRLMPREQNELLESLGSLDYPARCPHGRRIFYNIDNDTISDWFERPKDDLCAR